MATRTRAKSTAKTARAPFPFGIKIRVVFQGVSGPSTYEGTLESLNDQGYLTLKRNGGGYWAFPIGQVMMVTTETL